MEKPNFLEIINRIKDLTGLKTDSEVAKVLGFSQASLSEHKERGSIPYRRIIEWAINNGHSLDWVLEGNRGGILDKGVTPKPLLPEHRGYVDKLITIFNKGNKEKVGRLKERIDLYYEEIWEKEAEPPKVAEEKGGA